MIRIPTFPYFASSVQAKVCHGFDTPKELNIFGAYISFTQDELLDHFGGQLTSLKHHPFQELYRINSANGLTLRITKRNRNDAGFSTWMEGFVLKNQDNPYVPRVHSYARLNTGKTICIMEELSVLPNSDDLKKQLVDLTIPLVVHCFGEVEEAAASYDDPEAMAAALTFIKNAAEANKKLMPFLGVKSCLGNQAGFVILDPLG